MRAYIMGKLRGLGAALIGGLAGLARVRSGNLTSL